MVFMCAYITKKWSRAVHGWLFFYCIATLINNAGYLEIMLSRTLGEAILSLQLSYLGRAWIPFSIFQFVLLLCEVPPHKRTLNALAVFHAVIYVLVLTIKHNTLYYSSFDFVEEGLFPHIIHTNGIIHHIYNVLIILYAISGIFLLFRAIKKQKSDKKRHQLIFVTAAIFTDILFFIFEILHTVEEYDITSLGYTIASVFLYIAVFHYDLLGTKELARQAMIDRLSEGIIATDCDGVIQYFNEKAKNLFENLEVGTKKIPDEILKIAEEKNHAHIEIGGKIIAAEKRALTKNGKSFGHFYALIDETEHVRYMEKKEEQKIQQIQIEAMKKQLQMGNETIFAIANAVEARDKNTGKHSYRVSEYAVQIAQELGFSAEAQEQLRKMGLLHDIGKIGVPDSILNKPARLTDDEYATMKTHTTIGGEILKDFTLILGVDEGAKFHHERYDGKGYPNGLKGEEIPLNARIIGIADAFDAMTANRVYRKALDIDFVKNEIARCAGTQFDPKIAKIMLRLIESGKIDATRTVQESEK